MKRHTFLMTIASVLITMASAGCDVSMGGSDLPGDDTPTDWTPQQPPSDNPTVNPDAPPATTDGLPYYAVFIEDRWDKRCATSSVGAHGADIDAVGLWDPTKDPANPELVAWLQLGDGDFSRNECDEYGYTNLNEALGPPDGSLTSNFYSLAGGWLIGEFENQIEILPEYQITVHEVDDEFCGSYQSCVGSEGYDVYLATDLDCVNTGADFRKSCMIKLTGAEGAEGSATLAVPRFTR